MTTADKATAFTYETIKTSEFMNYPEVHCQRNTSQRVHATAKLLITSPSIRHLEVAVGEYPDGTRVVLDGNTRRLAWQLYASKLELPTAVLATVYKVSNKTEAEKLYETFDSSKAVETGKNKMYSALKTVLGEDTIENFRSTTVRKGILTSALRQATTILKDAETNTKAKWRRDSIEDLRRVVFYYSDEIVTLDRLISIKDTHGLNQAMYAAALMSMKKYGHDNVKLIDGLSKWFTGDWQPTISHYNGGRVDGVCWMVRHSASHPFYGAFVGQTRQDQIVYVLDMYLYCIDQFMADKTIKSVNELNLMGYYSNYGKRNNFDLLRTRKQVARETNN